MYDCKFDALFVIDTFLEEYSEYVYDVVLDLLDHEFFTDFFRAEVNSEFHWNTSIFLIYIDVNVFSMLVKILGTILYDNEF